MTNTARAAAKAKWDALPKRPESAEKECHPVLDTAPIILRIVDGASYLSDKGRPLFSKDILSALFTTSVMNSPNVISLFIEHDFKYITYIVECIFRYFSCVDILYLITNRIDERNFWSQN